MSRIKPYICLFTLCLFLSVVTVAYAQVPQVPASQTAGGIDSRERDIEKEKRLEKTIGETKKAEVEEESAQEVAPVTAGKKVTIKSIKVEGVTLLSQQEVDKVIAPYRDKELTLEEMQKVADLITDAYRTKGYATSRAYLPPQTIKDGVLLIKVIEGKLGQVDIKGNRFFKSSLLRRKMELKPGGYFDYSALQNSLVFINDSPDRLAKAVLVPGKEPGTTDVVLNVEDRFPMHVGFEYDNWGSRYIERNRWSFLFDYNNVLGLDDRFSFKLQKSESDLYELKTGRYILPITNRLEFGAYYSRSDLKLGKEFKPLDAHGKATVIGAFFNHALIATETLDLRCSFGFDYKDIYNYLFGEENSRDELRVFKHGVDADITDKFGRSIILAELDMGVADIMGGMPEKDEHASRFGAGGKFNKGVFNIFRLQPMPFSTSLLIKNAGQISAYRLVASEQFQIGGPTSVRGYPPGEFSGDKGWYTAAELSLPLYFLPKGWKVPFTAADKLYDTLRFVTFYDWATVHLNGGLEGIDDTKKNRTLRGTGFGLRFNLRDTLTMRIEVGYHLGGPEPSDGEHVRPWIEFTSRF